MMQLASVTKLAFVAVMVLALQFGQPLQAKSQATPPSTGKPLSAPLLGKSQQAQAQHFSPGGQALYGQIEPADTAAYIAASGKAYRGILKVPDVTLKRG